MHIVLHCFLSAWLYIARHEERHMHAQVSGIECVVRHISPPYRYLIAFVFPRVGAASDKH